MSFRSAFRDFDPLKGDPGDYFPMDLDMILERSREILKDRSSEEIFAALNTLEWMMREGEQYQTQQIIEELKDTEEGGVYITSAGTLERYMPMYDISGQEDFPNAKWEEYFAILALAIIGSHESYVRRSHDHENFFLDDKPSECEIEILRNKRIGRGAISAMEAICKAEALRNVYVQVEDKAKEKISLRNKKAAIARHRKTSELKDEFITYRASGKFQSDNDAARKFYQSLPDEKKRLISENNHVEFLTKALRAHKKRLKTPE